jgi:hypothetical protein
MLHCTAGRQGLNSTLGKQNADTQAPQKLQHLRSAAQESNDRASIKQRYGLCRQMKWSAKRYLNATL